MKRRQRIDKIFEAGAISDLSECIVKSLQTMFVREPLLLQAFNFVVAVPGRDSRHVFLRLFLKRIVPINM